MKNFPPTSANLPNPLRKLGAAVATIAAIGLALMFSVVAITVILLVGTIAWGYVWWKARDLRKQMRNYPFRDAMMEGDTDEGNVIRGEVIEGEVIRVVDIREVE